MGRPGLPTTFTTLGSSRSCGFTISAASVAISTARSSRQSHCGGEIGGCKRRQIALHVDDNVNAAAGIELLQRLVNAVGARGVIGTGHQGAPTRLFHRLGDGRRIGGDPDKADFRTPSRGAKRARSSARRRCRRAACPAAVSRPCGRGIKMRTSGIAAARLSYTGCKTRGKPAICASHYPAPAEPSGNGFV